MLTHAVRQTYLFKQDDLPVFHPVFTKYFIGAGNAKHVIVDAVANFQEDLGGIAAAVLISVVTYVHKQGQAVVTECNL